jgi:hypothetical protein
MYGMANLVQHPLLAHFVDSKGAADLLCRSRSTVTELADRDVLTRYRVGAAVLYYRPQVEEVADALKRLRARR